MSDAKIRVKLRGYDAVVLDRSAKSIIESAISTGAKVAGPIPLPTRKRKVAVNRSTFIYKSSIEHFEISTHKRVIDIIDPTPRLSMHYSIYRCQQELRSKFSN